MTVPSSDVTLDARALADLRSRLITCQKRILELEAEIGRLGQQLAAGANELADARAEVDELVARQEALQELASYDDELTEALRLAQVTAWDSEKKLADLEEERAKLKRANDELEFSIRRIVDSRAWRAVSRYRSLVKRVRGS